MKVGAVVRWKGAGKQRHYGVVTEIKGNDVTVSYTHSTPASNQQSGRLVTLHRMRLVVT